MLSEIVTALTATGYEFAHYGWSKAQTGDYGVYAEDGANDLEANDKHAEKAIVGTVDYFTRNDTGAPKAVIEAALDASGAAWSLNSIQFEEDTGFIHYEWVFETGD